jgi:hypothetical protein
MAPPSYMWFVIYRNSLCGAWLYCTWFLQYTALISPYTIHRLIFVIKAECSPWGVSYIYIHSFIYFVVCLTTGPNLLPNPALHIVRSRASSFGWEYHLRSFSLSKSFLRLLPRLPGTSTLIYKYIYHKFILESQSAFGRFINCGIQK